MTLFPAHISNRHIIATHVHLWLLHFITAIPQTFPFVINLTNTTAAVFQNISIMISVIHIVTVAAVYFIFHFISAVTPVSIQIGGHTKATGNQHQPQNHQTHNPFLLIFQKVFHFLPFLLVLESKISLITVTYIIA